MTAFPTLPDLTPTLLAWAQAHEAVRAVLLTSTRAVPGAALDILSDYDLILVVTDLQPWVSERAWLEDFGEVLVAYWDPVQPDPHYPIDYCANVVQYASGLKIDFTLWPLALFAQIAAAPALLPELDAGYRVLLDKDALTGGLRPPGGRAYIPAWPTQAAYQTLINDFFSEVPYVAKCLWRDDLWPARWCLEYDLQYAYLLPMLEWRVEIDHGGALPVGYLGKGLKKHLPPDLWAALEQTYAGPALDEHWAALAHLVALFRRVAVEVGQHLDYAYPEDLHRRVCAYVDQIRALPRG